MNKEYIDYKNFQISSQLVKLIKYMEPVEQIREKLYELIKNWDNLSLLSQLGDAGINMDKIKNDFTNLSSELIDHFGMELLQKNISEINSKAQVSVDIVIRNLFERTADIGFLATDDMIKDFLIKYKTRYVEGYAKNAPILKKRFLEYAKKYSVYFDIVLMNCHGDILLNIDDENKAVKSHDPIIQEVITTSDEYIETFKYHDFLPHHKQSLVYSYKLTESNEPDSQVLGVLCLCFKFEDEMDAIFKNLINPQTKECLTLLDTNGKVIATSDKYHIPLEAHLEIVLDAKYKIISFGGRDYIAKSCKTNGYQGFYGLGWYGHIMVPLEYAFSQKNENEFDITEELLLAILQHSDKFSKSLKQIPLHAENIQENLNRAIWNGNIKQINSNNDNQQFSKALLYEIRKTGEATKNIIGLSMAELTKTMVLSDSAFLADLIVDIMDRNLYERANDCRWWALTPDFRKILEDENIDAEARRKMSSILAYINNLYTVYTNLFIYDKDGIIQAVSNPKEEYIIGKKLSNRWVSNTLTLSDTSKYFVSDFEASSLYENDYTYIYNAAIRSLKDEDKVIGGIGIVFDSKNQFKEMINDSLPKQITEDVQHEIFCVLATKEQKIISSNDANHKTGEFFDIDKKFFDLKTGESLSEIIIYQDNYYALGVKCSKGYREYKSQQDDYVNNVYSFVFSYISSVNETVVESVDESVFKKELPLEIDKDSIEVATFIIGSKWLGVHTNEVVEAVSITELNSTLKLDNSHHFHGTMIYKDSVVSVINIEQFIQDNNRDYDYEEIVILKFGEKGYIGILVNALSDIPIVNSNDIKPLNEYIIGNGTLIQSVVLPSKVSSSKDVLSILSIEKINKALVEPNLSHMKKRTTPF